MQRKRVSEVLDYPTTGVLSQTFILGGFMGGCRHDGKIVVPTLNKISGEKRTTGKRRLGFII